VIDSLISELSLRNDLNRFHAYLKLIERYQTHARLNKYLIFKQRFVYQLHWVYLFKIFLRQNVVQLNWSFIILIKNYEINKTLIQRRNCYKTVGSFWRNVAKSCHLILRPLWQSSPTCYESKSAVCASRSWNLRLHHIRRDQTFWSLYIRVSRCTKKHKKIYTHQNASLCKKFKI